jgi:hypothetical protein
LGIRLGVQPASDELRGDLAPVPLTQQCATLKSGYGRDQRDAEVAQLRDVVVVECHHCPAQHLHRRLAQISASKLGPEAVEVLVELPPDDVALRTVVAEDRPPANAYCGGDVIQSCLFEAVTSEQLRRDPAYVTAGCVGGRPLRARPSVEVMRCLIWRWVPKDDRSRT